MGTMVVWLENAGRKKEEGIDLSLCRRSQVGGAMIGRKTTTTDIKLQLQKRRRPARRKGTGRTK